MYSPDENFVPDAEASEEDMVVEPIRDYEKDPWAEGPVEVAAVVTEESEEAPDEYLAGMDHKEKVKEKKTPSFFEKATLLVVSAILFGAIAGGVFVGITALDRYFNSKNEPQDKIELGDVSENDVVDGDDKHDVSLQQTNVPEIEGDTATNLVSVTDVSGVVESVMPAVVAINCYETYRSSGWYGSSEETEVLSGSGSGIIVGQNDVEVLIVTNNHVIEGAERITIAFSDGTSVDGSVKGTAPSSDLAVVAVNFDNMSEETLSAIRIARLGNSDDVVVGEMAIAIGNALGYGQSVTVGYISAKDRQVTVDNVTYTLIQTDAAINPGNSGGALLNRYGEVIGINSVKYSDSSVEGMGFAIPISNITDIIQELSNREELDESESGYLGIQVGKEITREFSNMLGIPQGLYVSDVVKDSPAEKGGIYAGDIIVKVDNVTVATMSDLQSFLSYTRAGTQVEVTVQRIRNGEYREIVLEITLDTKPETN